jgi:hypothetical protein
MDGWVTAMQHPTVETARQGRLIFWFAVDVNWRSSP